MQTVLTVLVAAAMLATLGVLVAGMIGMARGADGGTSQKLMRYRVLFQFLALVLFGLLLMLVRN
ncbi:MAG: twin transmembrane helix small protein [Roseococcus sp.]|nr:twin transmembrane helix small protein [Roseococcus sp.]